MGFGAGAGIGAGGSGLGEGPGMGAGGMGSGFWNGWAKTEKGTITTDNITSIVGDKLSRNKVEGAQRDRTLALLKGYQHG